MKRYSSNERLSRETTAYTADVWVDGVLSFTASNHGTGGCDDYHPIYKNGKSNHETYDAAMSKIKAYCACTAPVMIGTLGHKFEHAIDVEDLVQEAVSALEDAKFNKREIAKIKKKMATTVYVFDPEKNSVRELIFKVKSPLTEAHFKVIRNTAPALTILNSEGAEAIFRRIVACLSTGK